MPPRPAASAIVIHENRLLLVRRARPPAADLYAFPGGKVERGETPDMAALRELKEETGLDGLSAELFAEYDLPPEPGGPPEHHFFLSVFCVDVRGDPQTACASSDAAGLGWFSLKELNDLPVPPSVSDCVERLAQARKVIE
ncbi:NUDIX hydrolase [Allorhizobium sonneratiae]|uniref:NUDIX hydrolase n=1 Tax=Allorhizobium sonneratiae TaxID=2934936 RepID=UPI0030840EE3